MISSITASKDKNHKLNFIAANIKDNIAEVTKNYHGRNIDTAGWREHMYAVLRRNYALHGHRRNSFSGTLHMVLKIGKQKH